MSDQNLSGIEELNTANQMSKSDGDSKGTANAGRIFAWVLYAVAVALLVVAFVVTYADVSYDNKVVGGDAYNFIIFAGRGMVWAAASVTFAVLGLACQMGAKR